MTPHTGFIVAAYGVTAVVLVALALWLVLDGRTQRKRLADLEMRGITRRSAQKASGGVDGT